MTKARQGLNIIEFDPNTTCYGKRIPKEAWDKIRVQVLPYLALPVAKIREQLESQEIYVTENQLYRKIRTWRSEKEGIKRISLGDRSPRDLATLKQVGGREKKKTKDIAQTPRVRVTPRFTTMDSTTSNIDSDLESTPQRTNPPVPSQPSVQRQKVVFGDHNRNGHISSDRG
ncbi:uncharacterized protein PV07_12848 [Cladophialophora immunda]|uniref:Uncharacterized protein n=1 Tax=Cladophialophora immunda TaxID=569365 RepID=A0A0D2BTG9_9EURO|nr:uncharacterized protein PV07_12848 [Cladophialophora immunda]KIW21720.1 hypothetical protein PV07_12848 [Cladophialophora immunda]